MCSEINQIVYIWEYSSMFDESTSDEDTEFQSKIKLAISFG